MTEPAPGLAEFLEAREIVVCLGSGGVGKTSISAALGVAAAWRGRRCCVVTIDPARRLADALGLDALDNVPVEVAGTWPGSLHAVMLDARATFDTLVARYARDEAQRERIATNRLYLSLVEQLAGTQEYMATEKLYELHATGDFDLVVVDTPPARAALDFLHAPSRLAAFLDNRVLRLLLAPGRASLRAMGIATRALLRTIGRIAGAEVVDDTIAFFQAFEGMEEGFRERARRVESLLVDERTGYVLVTGGRRDEAAETRLLGESLGELGHRVDVLVANRDLGDLGDVAAPLAPEHSSLRALADNLTELAALARVEHELLGALGAELEVPTSVAVPLFEGDIHDLAGLSHLAEILVPRLALPRGESADRERRAHGQ